MMRAWLVLALLVLGVAAARAIPAAQQIIIFGSNSSASGGGGGGSCAGTINLSTGCAMPMLGGL